MYEIIIMLSPYRSRSTLVNFSINEYYFRALAFNYIPLYAKRTLSRI